MSLTIIILSAMLFCSNAFLPPPQIIPIISKLERIITSKAISASFFMNLRNEITVERIFAEVTEFNIHTTNYIYISILLTYIYGQYKFMKGSETIKLKKIEKYEKIERIIREIFFIIIFIFTKDVQRVL